MSCFHVPTMMEKAHSTSLKAVLSVLINLILCSTSIWLLTWTSFELQLINQTLHPVHQKHLGFGGVTMDVYIGDGGKTTTYT